MNNENLNFENPQDQQNEFITSLLQRLVGPEMSGFLEMLITKSFGSAFKLNMPGGGQFSAGGLMSPSNVGLAAMDAAQRRMEARMERSLDQQQAVIQDSWEKAAERATGARTGSPGDA